MEIWERVLGCHNDCGVAEYRPPQALEDVVKDANPHAVYGTIPPNKESVISLTVPKCLARYPSVKN